MSSEVQIVSEREEADLIALESFLMHYFDGIRLWQKYLVNKHCVFKKLIQMEATVFKARSTQYIKDTTRVGGSFKHEESPNRRHRRLGTHEGCVSPSHDSGKNSIVIQDTTSRDQKTLDMKHSKSNPGPFASFMTANFQTSDSRNAFMKKPEFHNLFK